MAIPKFSDLTGKGTTLFGDGNGTFGTDAPIPNIIHSTSYHKPNYYKVSLPITDNEQLTSFLCTNAVLPFFKTKEDKIFYNGMERKFASGYDHDQASFTFYLDKSVTNASSIWLSLMKWQGLLMPQENLKINGVDINSTSIKMSDNTAMFISYKKEYAKDFVIELINERDTTYLRCTLKNAYPFQINPVDLSYDNGNSIAKISIVLNFDWINYEFFSDANDVSLEKRSKMIESTKGIFERLGEVSEEISDGYAKVNQGLNALSYIKNAITDSQKLAKNKINNTIKNRTKQLKNLTKF